MRTAALLMGLVFVGLANGATVSVEINSSSKFTPNRIQVRLGDTVEFTNHSMGRHTVTADPSLAKDPTHVMLPNGAEPFNSGILAPGKSFSHTFTVAGVYQYVCLPHELHGMMGQVEVLTNDAGFEADSENL